MSVLGLRTRTSVGPQRQAVQISAVEGRTPARGAAGPRRTGRGTTRPKTLDTDRRAADSAAPSAGGERAVAQSPSTLIATLSANIAKYSGPAGRRTGTVPGAWLGAASSLPVIAQDDGYLDVRLAQRPDGSTAWILATAVRLSVTPYRIVVDLHTEHLRLYKNGELVLDAPAGVGTAVDPTPTGNFFVALLERAPAPAWGPFIVVTSGHSRRNQRLGSIGRRHRGDPRPVGRRGRDRVAWGPRLARMRSPERYRPRGAPGRSRGYAGADRPLSLDDRTPAGGSPSRARSRSGQKRRVAGGRGRRRLGIRGRDGSKRRRRGADHRTAGLLEPVEDEAHGHRALADR